MLSLVSLGLGDEKDITLRGLELARKAKEVYLENYTSPFLGKREKLEKLVKKKIILADREVVETKIDQILERAKKEDIVFLVVGDIFAATTHVDLILRARKKKVKVNIVHNASIITAVAQTGLSLYKFGKVGSIPFVTKDWKVESPYDLLKENKGMHTLFLLDLRPEEKRFMSFNEALAFLLGIEERRKENLISNESVAVVCCALGTKKQVILSGKVKDLMKKKVKVFPQALILTTKLHFIEEEALEFYKV